MRLHHRLAVLAGAAVVLGTGTALAQIMPRPPAPDMYGSGPLHGRLSVRMLRDFDLNKDGRITKAEMDKALARRFADIAAGGQGITASQLATAHEKMLRKHTDTLFRRIDWNGDGVLSLDEFRAPLRARFERRDRDGTGTISCKWRGRHDGRASRKGRSRGHHGRHYQGRFTKACEQADLNRDGKVTHAEFDRVVADQYAAAVKGGKGMTPGAFYRIELVQFRKMEARRFKRLDKNHDGKLSEAEFEAPARKLFARLDTNNDGVLSKDELARRHYGHRRGGRNRKPR